jgi:hypothetical protein
VNTPQFRSSLPDVLKTLALIALAVGLFLVGFSLPVLVEVALVERVTHVPDVGTVTSCQQPSAVWSPFALSLLLTAGSVVATWRLTRRRSRWLLFAYVPGVLFMAVLVFAIASSPSSAEIAAEYRQCQASKAKRCRQALSKRAVPGPRSYKAPPHVAACQGVSPEQVPRPNVKNHSDPLHDLILPPR